MVYLQASLALCCCCSKGCCSGRSSSLSRTSSLLSFLQSCTTWNDDKDWISSLCLFDVELTCASPAMRYRSDCLTCHTSSPAQYAPSRRMAPLLRDGQRGVEVCMLDRRASLRAAVVLWTMQDEVYPCKAVCGWQLSMTRHQHAVIDARWLL